MTMTVFLATNIKLFIDNKHVSAHQNAKDLQKFQKHTIVVTNWKHTTFKHSGQVIILF